MKKKLFIFIIPLVFMITGFYWVNKSLSIQKPIFNKEKDDTSINVLFSQTDNIREKILSLIKHETKRILCAAFRLTDKDIASALLDAYSRGVIIDLIVDKEGFSSIYSKLLHMFKAGIDVFIYPKVDDGEISGIKESSNSSKKGIMHNKVLMFYTEKIILTGSYNFTKSAQDINQENVVIIKNEAIFRKYYEYFTLLKGISTKLSTKDNNISLFRKKEYNKRYNNQEVLNDFNYI